MQDYNLILTKLTANAAALETANVKKVLMLYEEKIQFIGDCCKRFDKLSYFSTYLDNAVIDINFAGTQNQKFYDGLLKNNPYLDGITTMVWDDINFRQYDVVFCIAYGEQRILEYLANRYGNVIASGEFPLAVFSISELILRPVLHARYVFPVHTALVEYIKVPRPGRLYISSEEQHCADRWLEERGFAKNEHLFIMVDSTTAKYKLIDLTVYFDLLTHLLNAYNCRILVFDEANIGKEEFYQEWVGDKFADRIIVSKGLTLRENLCLIGSSYARLIFGPCTGLMHCASAIYNNYLSEGMAPENIPLMITYTGEYTAENINANFWWGNSPLVHCLMLRKHFNKIKMVTLHQLSEDQKLLNDSLPCSEYTSEMLVEFIDKHIGVAAVAAPVTNNY